MAVLTAISYIYISSQTIMKSAHQKMKHFVCVACLFAIIHMNANAEQIDIMDLSLEELMQVRVISATKRDEEQMEAPLSISVITRKEIIQAGASSWGDALRLLPGTLVREQSAGNYDIHIRGFDNIPPNSLLPFLANSLTLVMIDNRIVYNYFAGGTFWETLPISLLDVDRIELVRGPASPLYGPNAVSGVIHIITRHAKSEGFRFNGRAEAGENNTNSAALWIQYESSHWSWLTSANYQQRDRKDSQYFSLVEERYINDALDLVEFDTQLPSPLNNRRFPDQSLARELKGINTTLLFKPENSWHYEMRLGHQDSKAQTAYFENGVTPLNTTVSNSTYLDLVAQHQSFKAQVSVLDGEQEALGIAGWQWQFDTLDAQFEYQYQVTDNFLLRPALSYRNASYDGIFIQGEKHLITNAASVHADFRPAESWRIIGAVRADQYHTPDTTETSSQLAINYYPNQQLHWRFSMGRSHRAPFILDIFQNTAFTTPTGLLFELKGNQELDPLVSKSAEIGVRYKISSKALFEAEFFYAKNKNYSDVQLNFVGNDGNFFRTSGQYENLPLQTSMNGVTLSHSQSLSEQTYFRGFVTFVENQIDNHIQPPETPITSLPDINLIDLDSQATPNYYGGFLLNHTQGNWNYNWNFYFYDDHRMSHVIVENDIASKVIANFKLTHRISNTIDIYLNIRNIENSQENEFLFTDKVDRQITLGFDIDT
ncbi:TonB-dependent receptor plug domain-containing protein [Aliikangiella coralliicola]|uniref:TonB-dependent receptor plug domain-containing protein n=1 Tax=Aliikangiella coralliicola TaxID=2592383 RepID=A0A545U6K7_9GAMM|nr:TonB-dependent receptor plug domain-containing protein [Aliikangiella coralliicola]TQV85043.1 hypothetical protein FLL46_21895 [Aliikangiella coralliicola]